MSLKKLEKLNNHKRDLRIKFDSENHIYSVDENKNYISVTQLVSKFFPEFDKDFWAEKQSNKLGIPKDEILMKWENLGNKARDAGTNLHLQIENFYNHKNHKNSREFEKFLDFHHKYIINNYKPFRTEWKIFDEKKLIAGTLDMVYKKPDGSLFIFDWKRSKNIINSNGSVEKENPYENGLKGLSHLSSSDYIKYSLQQNIYKYILEKYYEKKVSSMNLLILHPHYEKYHIVKIDEFQLETKYLIDNR
jgi:ATP-dependent exoDNAse (exonuclease V) beta subunit